MIADDTRVDRLDPLIPRVGHLEWRAVLVRGSHAGRTSARRDACPA